MPEFQITVDTENRRDLVIEKYTDIQEDIELLSKLEKGKDPANREIKTFFCEEYLKANWIVTNITNDKEDLKTGEKDSSKVKNNIIVFSGDRGSGKTSAMMSFGKFLEHHKDGKTRYKLLEMIDPSYFRKNESILLNIITLMFKMAKQYNTQDYGSNNEFNHYEEFNKKLELDTSKKSMFNELLRSFEKVFRSVKRMDSIIPKEDSLEYLNELSDAIDLNRSIHELIKVFLRFFEDGPKYLVLMIDDLDMNVSYAATMLEQIRKFLIHDNIIILFASNMDQLQFEMKESYSKYYDKIIQPTLQTPSISVDVEEMATKYLLKLFPPLQRIHISDAANKLIHTKLEIDGTIRGDLQTVILNLIWRKTRLIFIPENTQLHPLIPTNLRALRQFIYLLIDMEKLDKKEYTHNKRFIFTNTVQYANAQKNFGIFKDYILNVWIPSNVSFEEKKVFDNIPKDISRINKHLIQSINVIASKYKKSILIKEIDPIRDAKNKFDRDFYTFVSHNDPKFQHANKISDIFNFPSNNTAGDILLLIDKYKTYFEAANQNTFIEAVKIYYSLLLFETMFFSNIKKDTDGKDRYEVRNSDSVNPETKCFNDLINISNIQKLIGGTLFFPHYFNIIKSSQYDRFKKIHKEEIKLRKNFVEILKRNIDEERLIILAKNILFEAEYDEERFSLRRKLSNILRDTNNKGSLLKRLEEAINADKSLLDESGSKPAENHLFYNVFDDDVQNKQSSKENALYVLFFILYYGGSRPERSFGIRIYNTKEIDVNKKNDKYRFDILSLLVNSLNPEQTLARFLYKNKKTIDTDYLELLKNRIDKWKNNSTLKVIISKDNPLKSNDIETKEEELTFEKSDPYMQNFILPIYSVDLMLIYLREQFDAAEIGKTFNEPDKVRKMTKKVMEQKIRTPDFIFDYYEKLNSLTKKALNQIEYNVDSNKKISKDALDKVIVDWNNIEISTMYQNIYKSGIECFIKQV